MKAAQLSQLVFKAMVPLLSLVGCSGLHSQRGSHESVDRIGRSKHDINHEHLGALEEPN